MIKKSHKTVRLEHLRRFLLTPPSSMQRRYGKFPSEMKLAIDVSYYMKTKWPEVIFKMDYGGMNLSKTQRGQMKLINPYRGHPDFTIYQPVGNFTGLHLELKKSGEKIRRSRDAKKRAVVDYHKVKGVKIPVYEHKVRKAGDYLNSHIEEQAVMMNELRKFGRLAGFSVGLEDTLKIIEGYLHGWEDMFNLIIK